MRKKWQWIGFSILALFNLGIYFPSFFHIARSDQLIYLANTTHNTDWFSLAIKSYSYDRVNHPFYGYNALLFRPLVFFILGSEKWLFGYNFMLWQITGFLLHLFVLWNLLKLLLRIRLSIFAVFLTLYFSFLFIAMEMVIWHHINSYLIFISCILISLYHLYSMTSEKQVRLKSLWIIFACLLIASFIYEIGCVYSLLFFIYLWIITPYRTKLPAPHKGWNFLILLPGVLYLIANILDFRLRGSTFMQGDDLLNTFHLGQTIKNTLFSFYWWIYTGIFPSLLHVSPFQRTIFNANDLFDFQKFLHLSHSLKFHVFSALGLILTYLLILQKKISWISIKIKWPFMCLIIIMLTVQVSVIVIGRINTKKLMEVFMNNSYYGYLFWTYLVIFAYALISTEKIKTAKIFPLLKISAIIFLALSIFSNGYLVFKMNQKRAKSEMVRRFLIQDIERLKQQPGNQDNFSFGLDPALALNLAWIKKASGDQDKIYTYLELLYPDFKKTYPKYYYKLEKDGIKRGQLYD